MTRQRIFGTLTLACGVIALAGLPVWAQEGSRPSNGNTSGSAVSRDSGGGGSSSGSSSSSSNSGGSSASSSGGSGVSGDSRSNSPTPSSWSSFEAPARADRSSDQAGSRSRSGSSSGQAVSRGDGGGSRGSSSPRSAGSTASASGGSDSSAPTRRAVPEYSRPRDGRTVSGLATARGSVPPPHGNGGAPIIVYPYDPWGFWGGYGLGLGYLYYDPFYYGGYGFGSPYGYGGYGYGGYGSSGSGGYGVSQSYRETGSVRLKVDPKQAQVFVDGYYVGVIDSFDGAFQKLELEGGGHKIELKADGFEPFTLDVLITPGETVTYKGEMKPIR
jgi:PEGA domain